MLFKCCFNNNIVRKEQLIILKISLVTMIRKITPVVLITESSVLLFKTLPALSNVVVNMSEN